MQLILHAKQDYNTVEVVVSFIWEISDCERPFHHAKGNIWKRHDHF